MKERSLPVGLALKLGWHRLHGLRFREQWGLLRQGWWFWFPRDLDKRT